MTGRSSRSAAVDLDRGRLFRLLRSTAVLLPLVVFTGHASGDEATLTVQGEGFASKAGAGELSATLPDGTVCTVVFSGGKMSLFGHSAAKGKVTCVNGTTARSARAVVYRKRNGLPREATLTFSDGTKVLVLIPPEAARRPPPTP
jgi:hypothetical protein